MHPLARTPNRVIFLLILLLAMILYSHPAANPLLYFIGTPPVAGAMASP